MGSNPTPPLALPRGPALGIGLGSVLTNCYVEYLGDSSDLDQCLPTRGPFSCSRRPPGRSHTDALFSTDRFEEPGYGPVARRPMDANGWLFGSLMPTVWTKSGSLQRTPGLESGQSATTRQDELRLKPPSQS